MKSVTKYDKFTVMEFLAIMVVGTLIAIWVVINLRPKHPIQRVAHDYPSATDSPPLGTPAWTKGAEHVQPMGELEYLEAVERHDKDPAHYPFPSPPPRALRTDSATEEY